MANIDFSIDNDVVNEKLTKIDGYIDDLDRTINNMRSNISAGWNSQEAHAKVTPAIESVKDSIVSMKKSVSSVRTNVQKYMSNVHNVDTAGNIGGRS